MPYTFIMFVYQLDTIPYAAVQVIHNHCDLNEDYCWMHLNNFIIFQENDTLPTNIYNYIPRTNVLRDTMV